MGSSPLFGRSPAVAAEVVHPGPAVPGSTPGGHAGAGRFVSWLACAFHLVGKVGRQVVNELGEPVGEVSHVGDLEGLLVGALAALPPVRLVFAIRAPVRSARPSAVHRHEDDQAI
jgi:hypothetical protein